jgi:thiol-disulfide isomerase/thioredoxin
MQRLLALVVALFSTGLVACESPSPDGDEQASVEAQKESAKPSKAADDKSNETEQAADKEAAPESNQEPTEEPSTFTGEIERDAILENEERWEQRYDETDLDGDVAEALSEVEPGARVEVYLGVWCGDSMREVPRFWRALDAAGDVPFDVKHVGLDETFSAGDVSLEEFNIEAVPTFIVYRDGEEVGRIVEDAPENIETHLLALLNGEASGVISASR